MKISEKLKINLNDSYIKQKLLNILHEERKNIEKHIGKAGSIKQENYYKGLKEGIILAVMLLENIEIGVKGK